VLTSHLAEAAISLRLDAIEMQTMISSVPCLSARVLDYGLRANFEAFGQHARLVGDDDQVLELAGGRHCATCDGELCRREGLCADEAAQEGTSEHEVDLEGETLVIGG
jgi:hypothetical protein